jgi:ribosomal protein L37AE/L43A
MRNDAVDVPRRGRHPPVYGMRIGGGTSMTIDRVSRKCPMCGEDAVIGRFAADRVYPSDSRPNRRLEAAPEATHVCSSCGSVRFPRGADPDDRAP